MASKAQEYITSVGQMTMNSLEGFHGIALKYRQKRVDLHHNHYTCKKNQYGHLPQGKGSCMYLGPLWKLLCLWQMGIVDAPTLAVTIIVKEHIAWQKQRMEGRKPKYR